MISHNCLLGWKLEAEQRSTLPQTNPDPPRRRLNGTKSSKGVLRASTSACGRETFCSSSGEAISAMIMSLSTNWKLYHPPHLKEGGGVAPHQPLIYLYFPQFHFLRGWGYYMDSGEWMWTRTFACLYVHPTLVGRVVTYLLSRPSSPRRGHSRLARTTCLVQR